MPAKTKIVSPGQVSADARVYIDGEEVPRSGLHKIQLDFSVGDVPQLVLTFHASEIEVNHGKEVVHVST